MIDHCGLLVALDCVKTSVRLVNSTRLVLLQVVNAVSELATGSGEVAGRFHQIESTGLVQQVFFLTIDRYQFAII